MELKSQGELEIQSGQALLEADYRRADVGAGALRLRVTNQETLECVEGEFSLDPWSADGYEIFDWSECRALAIVGTQAVISVSDALVLRSAVAFEYQEGETLDRPWFVEDRKGRVLVIATDRRVWCLDETARLRWIWSTRVGEREEWIRGTPTFSGESLQVPIRSISGEKIVALSLEGGVVSAPQPESR